MRIEIKRLHAQVPTTSVFVTHDQVEAMTLGDRVVVMRDGRVQQVGTPLPVYGKPANRFVAGFIGAPAMNFVDVTVRSAAVVVVEADGLRLTVTSRRTPARLRPTAAARDPGRAAGASRARRRRRRALGFDALVEVVEQLGSEILLETRVGDASVTVARVPAETSSRAGDQVRLSAQPGRLHFFDPETELPISA